MPARPTEKSSQMPFGSGPATSPAGTAPNDTSQCSPGVPTSSRLPEAATSSEISHELLRGGQKRGPLTGGE